MSKARQGIISIFSFFDSMLEQLVFGSKREYLPNFKSVKDFIILNSIILFSILGRQTVLPIFRK